jgi:speckle-type POZ protein
MVSLFQSNDYADVSFEVKGQVFLAHKAILKCKAPDLAELCETYGTTNPMPIEDVEPRIFKDMLGFVYGVDIDAAEWKSQLGYLLDPTKQSKSILRAACKYGISSLKSEAEIWYLKLLKLEVDRVIDNLLFADANNLPYVKEAAMDFIVINSEDVFASNSFQYLQESKPLLCEVLFALSRRLSGKKRKRCYALS